MGKRLWLSVTFMLVLFASAFGFRAFTADSDIVREAQDRAAIERLMWNYARALDSYDAEAYAAKFTVDGQFVAGNPTKGREALKKMISDLKSRSEENEKKTGIKPAPMYHMTANSYLEFVDKDHARLQAYWLTSFGAVGQTTPARVAAVGREVDELVKVNGQWLIKVRDVTPKE